MTIAALLAISTANIQNFFEEKFHSKMVATSVTTLSFALLFFGPFVYILTTLTTTLKSIDMETLVNFEKFIEDVITHPPSYLDFLQPYLPEISQKFDVNAMVSQVLSFTGKITAFSAGFIKNVFLILIFYFFAQFHSKTIVNFIKRVVQMDERDSSILAKELSSVMSVVFYSILVTAAFEGFLFGIAVSYLGYDGIFYGILFGFASLVPVVGAALMWVPFMSYEFFLGNSFEAIFIAVYTVVVISIIADTFIKPVIIQEINKHLLDESDTKLDSLVIFFSMIAGLSTFGFWGMILGPAITAFFLSILKVFEVRTKELTQQEVTAPRKSLGNRL
jgi:predicted PurR-regulated permease PerM